MKLSFHYIRRSFLRAWEAAYGRVEYIPQYRLRGCSRAWHSCSPELSFGAAMEALHYGAIIGSDIVAIKILRRRTIDRCMCDQPSKGTGCSLNSAFAPRLMAGGTIKQV